MRECKTCKHLRAPRAANGKLVGRQKRGYQCLAPIPEIRLPVSVKMTFSRSFMWVSDTQDCPAWEALDAQV